MSSEVEAETIYDRVSKLEDEVAALREQVAVLREALGNKIARLEIDRVKKGLEPASL